MIKNGNKNGEANLFSHGELNSRDVAILFTKKIKDTYEIFNVKTYQGGRYIIIECNIKNNNIVFNSQSLLPNKRSYKCPE